MANSTSGPTGAESVLLRHQLLILNRDRKRPPNLSFADRMIAGWCMLFVRWALVFRSAAEGSLKCWRERGDSNPRRAGHIMAFADSLRRVHVEFAMPKFRPE